MGGAADGSHCAVSHSEDQRHLWPLLLLLLTFSLLNLVPSVEPTDSGLPSAADDRRSNLCPLSKAHPHTFNHQGAEGRTCSGWKMIFFQCFFFFHPGLQWSSLVSSLTTAADLPKAAHLAPCLEPPARTERFVGPLYMLGKGTEARQSQRAEPTPGRGHHSGLLPVCSRKEKK